MAWNEDGLSAFIPTAELLLVYKLKAWRDRLHMRRTQALTAFEAAIIDSKIAKDEYDVRHLRQHAGDLDAFLATLPSTVAKLLHDANERIG